MSQKLSREIVEDMYALTSMQEGILFHYLNQTESSQYVEQLSIELSGNVDFSTFKKAWQLVFDTNEILRTIFRWKNVESAVQIVLKTTEAPIDFYNFSSVTGDELKKSTTAVKELDKREKINLESTPFRISLLKICERNYEMVITNHHILYDGWSNGIILKEFFSAYNCLSKGEVYEIPVKKKFKDFIRWYINQNKERQKRFWESYLEGFYTKTALPVRYDGFEEVLETKEYTYSVNSYLYEKIKKFIPENGITAANIIYAAWGILLLKYNNSNDVIFGTTVSGRTTEIEGIENIAGLFINTLPLRLKTDAAENVLSLFGTMGKDIEKREEYEHTPLVDIKAYSPLGGKDNLFDSIVVVENYPIEKALRSADNTLKVNSYKMTEMTNFQITLEAVLFDGITFHLSYNTGMFEKRTVERMVGHLVNILEKIVDNPKCNISEIEILSETEKNQLLYEFNNTKKSIEWKTIHRLFEDQAEKTPEKTALIYGNSSLSYRQVNQKADQLALYLASKGVKPGTLVGLIVERSFNMIIGLLSILKAGGAYVPLDPEYPSDRIDYIIEDSGVSIILTDESTYKSEKSSCEIVNINSEEIYTYAGGNIYKNSKPDDLAYVIYTSGSTGKPKGVMLEHRTVHNFIEGVCDVIDFYEDKTIAALTTVSFDIFVLETLLPLTKGMKVVIANKDEQKDIRLLQLLIDRNKIDMLQMTPSKLHMILAGGMGTECLKNVKEIMVGGEAFPPAFLKELKDIYNGKIFNMYGPTETTVWSTIRELTETENIDIGKPILNTQVYIVDKDYRLVPDGIRGELCISGDCLARGYLNREELTTEKFVDNPYNTRKKMYRTGDLAEWKEDGNLYFAGRIDNQVKIRGYRIELGEIENQLMNHTDIVESAVAIYEDDSKGKYLCAYVVSENDFTVSDLKEYLSKTLPEYMIPAYFVKVDKIPLTPNGKIDRNKLKNNRNFIKTGDEYCPPGNETEEKILSVWVKILGTDRISINDNFFDVGGNSILIVRMVAQINKLFPDRLVVTDVFKYPTIKKMSGYLMGENKKEEKLVLGCVQMPQQYFLNESRDVKGSVFNCDVLEDIFESVKKMSVKHNIGIKYILLAAFYYLLSEVSEKDSITVQTAVAEKSLIYEIEVDLSSAEDFIHLSKLLESKVSEKKKFYSQKKLVNIIKSSDENSIIPYFGESNKLINPSVSSVYDLCVEVQIDNSSARIIYSCNSERLREDVVESLIVNYMKILRHIADNY